MNPVYLTVRTPPPTIYREEKSLSKKEKKLKACNYVTPEILDSDAITIISTIIFSCMSLGLKLWIFFF